MQPLGQGKERWLTLDDQPADIHPYATLVRNLPGDHLADAAARAVELIFQILRPLSRVLACCIVARKPSHSAGSRISRNGSIDVDVSGTLLSSRSMLLRRVVDCRLQFWPLIGGEQIQLVPFDGGPVVLENSARIAGVWIPGPVRIAESAGFEEVDQPALPDSLAILPHRAAAKFAQQHGCDLLAVQPRPVSLPDRGEVLREVRRLEPGLRIDPRSVIVGGVDQLFGM